MNTRIEKNIRQFAVTDLEEKYKIKDMSRRLVLPNGSIVDIVAYNKSRQFLIHIKNKKVSDKDIWKVFENINVYSTWQKQNKVTGIVYCREADESVYELVRSLKGQIDIIEVNSNDGMVQKVKFTTTLSKETITMLKGIAGKYSVDNINSAIEILAKKEWRTHELDNQKQSSGTI